MKLTPHLLLIAVVAILNSSEGLSQTASDESNTSSKRADPARNTPLPLSERPSWTVSAPLYEAPDVSTLKASFNNPAAFQALSETIAPASTTLSPPVNLSYSGSSSVLTINNAGTGKGVQSLTTNTKSSTSALWGSTVGSGAGVSGYNGGTVGPAAKFGVLNAASSQPGVVATTNGIGPALLATVTNTSGTTIVINGINSSTDAQSVGVEGTARGFGVVGYSSEGVGVSGASDHDVGVYGSSGLSGIGVSAWSWSGVGLEVGSYSGIAAIFGGPVQFEGGAVTLDSEFSLDREATTNATALSAHNKTGWGAYVASDNSYGLVARSTNSHAIDAEDVAGGDGIYASSVSGFAGYFKGNVAVTGQVVSSAFTYLSDRNQKTDLVPVDGRQVLEKIAQLPIQSWDYRSDPLARHIGPMAQDFHAAFGLNGKDDTHISDVDIQGVSLAAIQELYRENSDLRRQNADLQKGLADLRVVVEGLRERDSH